MVKNMVPDHVWALVARYGLVRERMGGVCSACPSQLRCQSPQARVPRRIARPRALQRLQRLPGLPFTDCFSSSELRGASEPASATHHLAVLLPVAERSLW
jgi:hypothetical protein